MAIEVLLADNTSLWQTGRAKGVTHFRWLAHPELVKEVCAQCMYYHDTVWRLDDPSAPEAPLHPRCACTIEPQFQPDTELGQDPDGNPIIAEPAPALKPGEFLTNAVRSMDAKKMDEVLGPTRGQLIRSGVLKPAQLVSHKHGIRPIKTLLSAAQIKQDELRKLSFEELRKLSQKRLGRVRRRFTRRRPPVVLKEREPNPALFIQ